MRFRLRTLLMVLPLLVAVLAGYVYLQLEAIRVARESAEFQRAAEIERAKAADLNRP
jgi:hypothetical protein